MVLTHETTPYFQFLFNINLFHASLDCEKVLILKKNEKKQIRHENWKKMKILVKNFIIFVEFTDIGIAFSANEHTSDVGAVHVGRFFAVVAANGIVCIWR